MSGVQPSVKDSTIYLLNGSSSPPPFSTNHNFYLLGKDCNAEQKQDISLCHGSQIKDRKDLDIKLGSPDVFGASLSKIEIILVGLFLICQKWI